MNTVSTDQLTELVQPSLRHLGLDLVELQWRPGRSSILRLVIDSSAGVTLSRSCTVVCPSAVSSPSGADRRSLSGSSANAKLARAAAPSATPSAFTI